MEKRKVSIKAYQIKIAVYTVLIGSYDKLKDWNPNYKGQADFFVFTDQDIKTGIYKKISVVNESGDPTRESRKYKISPHIYLPGYDYYIYIDASIEVMASPLKMIQDNLGFFDIAIPKHRWRKCVYEEIDICRKLKLITPEEAEKHRDFLKKEGYPEKIGLSENGIILRRNNNKIRELCDFWQEIYDKSPRRDQLSLGYCLWKKGIKYNVLKSRVRLTLFQRTMKSYKIHAHKCRPHYI